MGETGLQRQQSFSLRDIVSPALRGGQDWAALGPILVGLGWVPKITLLKPQSFPTALEQEAPLGPSQKRPLAFKSPEMN